MTVDWSQFRDGDRVRVVFEGEFLDDGYIVVHHPPREMCVSPNISRHAASAELIERPFVAPEAGKLFRHRGRVYVSLGSIGFRKILTCAGTPTNSPASVSPWKGMAAGDIEVIDGV